MHILVTRPAAEAQATRARLAARGHRVLVEPVLRIVPRVALPPQGRFDAALATSANAFVDPDHPAVAVARGLPLAVVGERTAEAAAKAGFDRPAMVAPTAEALVCRISAEWTGPRLLLLLAGAHQAVDVAALLAPSGHRVNTTVVYESVTAERLGEAARRALGAGSIDAVLHYSARAAATLLGLCGPVDLTGPRHICLSGRVAAPLAAAGLAVEVAVRPDEAALLDQLDGSPAGQQS